MADLTLQEVAKRAGRSYDLVKKHAQRQRLRTTQRDGRTVVTEADFDAYMASETLEQAAEALRSGKSPEEVQADLGTVLMRLPQTVKDAILAGVHAGSPEPVKAALKALGKKKPRPRDELDEVFRS